MLRISFAIILLMHGLIHLLGFVKAFKFADISQLTQPITKPIGFGWLGSALLFTVAVAFFLLKKEDWWLVAVPAVVLSQVLIVTAWPDAKFGTVANIIALVGIGLAYGSWSFKALTDSELNHFRVVAASEKTTSPALLADLPPVVQKWLSRAGVVGKPTIQTVHLKQAGQMKTASDGSWIPFEAEQFFTVNPPGFIWTTEIQAAPMIHIVGRDKYEGGRGNMLIKLLALYPLADAAGPETDQGTMLRYLAETCWFPSAALNDYIRWEPVDSLAARATMTYGDITASGVFGFNTDGDMVSFEAKRYYDRKEGATLEVWQVRNSAWEDLSDGIRIPTSSEVTWKLDSGDYTWLKLDIKSIKYNEP